jgi:hypothetical protein
LAALRLTGGTSSDSGIGALLQRPLIALDDHGLFTTAPLPQAPRPA